MGAYELAGRREINDEENPSATTVWQVTGATSYGNARAILDAAPLPTSFTFPSSRVAYIDGVQATELRDDEFFEFTVSYRSHPRPEVNDYEYEFEISAPNEQLFQAIATASYAPSGKTAPDFKGAIGVRGGIAQGMPQLHPVSTFQITKYWAVADVDTAYQSTVEGLVGKVTNGTFHGRAAGTVKLLGARGRISGDKFPISYQFGFRPNGTPFVYNGITISTAPKGWELIDVYYEPFADTTAEKLVERARAVYVHQVAATDSLSGLAI